jgi:hypothetical protein
MLPGFVVSRHHPDGITTMTPLAFLELLFNHPSLEGLYLTIWDRQTKRTEAFQLPDLASAAVNAEARAGANDVYFGVCPYRQVAAGSRGNAGDAAAMVGLWADIDVAGPAHAKNDLPPTAVEAFDLLYECARPPTLIISSGYGLQAWWVFDEPFLIRTEADRIKAAKMAKGWVDHVQTRADRHGWKIDPVGDLARVLRLPGTKNHKQGEARPVEVMAAKGNA